LVDVQASWNKDKMLNTFIVKLTSLASLLSRSVSYFQESVLLSSIFTICRRCQRHLPLTQDMWNGKSSGASGINGGCSFESMAYGFLKGIMFVSSSSCYLTSSLTKLQGRDEALICSLSNFDAYYITRLQKTPRPFTFAVKSTDNLSFFENTADYLHMFSCSEKEGNAWMENILLARVSLALQKYHTPVTHRNFQSYVLHQERHILFNPKATNGNAAGAAGPLSRSATRKRPAQQPLVAVSPPFTGAQLSHSGDVFEPGSLLHKA
jgi:hypothetical protein